MDFEILSTPDEFIKLGDEIETGLLEYTDSFFFSPRWLTPFLQVLSSNGGVINIIGRDENKRIAGSMSLATTRTPFLKIFRPEVVAILGTRSVVSPEHLEFFMDRKHRDEWFKFFNEYFCRHLGSCSLAIFDSVAEDAENIEAMARYLEHSGYRVIKQIQDKCPYLDLPSSFDELLERYSSKKRKAIRRDLRQQGAGFEFVDYTAIGDTDKSLDVARKLHNFSRRLKGETGSFERTGYMEFHRRLARALAADNSLYFKFLLKDGEPVAFLYGFLSGGRFYDYQTGYNPEYSDLRPGFLILANAIQDLITMGIKRFDFLRGYEHYKLYWTDTVRKTYRYYILPPGLKSLIYYTLLKIYRGWR